MEIERITVFGAGKIGSQLAFRAAFFGYRVVLFDVNEDALLAARIKLHEISAQFKHNHDTPKYRIDEALARLSYCMNLREAVSKADIAIEAIPQDIAIKVNLFQQLSCCAPNQTIFITTSSQATDELSIESGRPERFMALRLATIRKKETKAEITLVSDTGIKSFYNVLAFLESIEMAVLPINVP